MTRCLLVCALLAFSCLALVAASDRLVEKDIAFPSALLSDVPLVDPPRRIAGYFKLNRTHDAHMFYFFYESRSKGAMDPVVLWMTGTQHVLHVACTVVCASG